MKQACRRESMTGGVQLSVVLQAVGDNGCHTWWHLSKVKHCIPKHWWIALWLKNPLQKRRGNVFWQTKPDGNLFIFTLSQDNLKIFILSHGQINSYLKENEMQEGKVVVWGGFTNSWEEKRNKRQGRKRKIYPTECRVLENSEGRKKAFLYE